MTRNWDALSATYRQRLERGGITRSAYEAGASLSAARGHAATPERPGAATAHPERYQAYLFKRDVLVQDIIRKKAELMGYAGKYNARRSRWHVNNFENGKPRSQASLQRVHDSIMVATSRNWEDLIEDLDDEDVSALYYH